MICGLLFTFFFHGCASTPPLPPAPPKYVYAEEKAAPATANSLWTDSASLYEDVKAKRLNDLVTINVIENIAGSGKADTNTSRDSSYKANADTVAGMTPALTGVNVFGQGKVTISPDFSAALKDDFKGSGETTRTGSLVGTITAKIVEVMPNGNLVLESRKDITINNEKQTLVLRGMIRPADIGNDNTILSNRVADAQVYFVGDGIIQRKQGQGWLLKFLDSAWPF